MAQEDKAPIGKRDALAALWRERISGPEGVARHVIDRLVSLGRLSDQDAANLREDLCEHADAHEEQLSKDLDALVGDYVAAQRLPAREELRDLRRRLNDLLERTERLEAALALGRSKMENHRD